MIKNFTPLRIKKKRKKITVGTYSKESEPIIESKEKSFVKEKIKNQSEKEVRPFIKIRPQSIKLPLDLKKLGLKSVKEERLQEYQKIKLPISDEKIYEDLKEPVTSSARWLATFALYLLKMAHLSLKKIRGRIIRVIRP